MKKIIVISFICFFTTSIFSQVDKYGSPVFNSELMSEEYYYGFELSVSYYTINNNISNPESSVFVNENPSLDDYLNFSRNLPSYVFTIHKGSDVVAMIGLQQVNEGNKTRMTYNIVDFNNGKKTEIPCGVFGEITEKRAEELEKLKPDPESEIINLPIGKLYQFNGIAFRIQPYEKVKNEILQLILLLGINKQD